MNAHQPWPLCAAGPVLLVEDEGHRARAQRHHRRKSANTFIRGRHGNQASRSGQQARVPDRICVTGHGVPEGVTAWSLRKKLRLEKPALQIISSRGLQHGLHARTA